MGLDKTLTTIVACLEVKQRGEVNGCFDLIVATASSAQQWMEELEHHFDWVKLGTTKSLLYLCLQPYADICQGRAPRALLYDDAKTTANELLDGGYDFVVVIYHMLENRYRRYQRYQEFYELVEAKGWDRAIRNLQRHEQPPDLEKRTYICRFCSYSWQLYARS